MKFKLVLSFIFITASSLAFSSPSFSANSGDLDTTYGTDGKASVSIPGYQTTVISDIITIEDGTIFGVGHVQLDGTSNTNSLFIKLTPKGTLDTSFGTNGYLILDAAVLGLNDSRDDELSGVAIQKDPITAEIKIIGVGTFPQGHTGAEGLIIRVSTDGQLDTSFGNMGNGVSWVFFGTVTDVDIYNKNSISYSNYIAISGETHDGVNYNMAAARLDQDGNLDASFGTNGIFSLSDYLDDYDTAVSLDTKTDGSLFLGGFKDYNLTNLNSSLIVSLSSTGTPNTGFASNGTLTYPGWPGLNQSGILNQVRFLNNKLYIPGYHYDHVSTVFTSLLYRYDNLGSLDTAFNTTGKIEYILSGTNGASKAVLRTSAGNILLGGFHQDSTGYIRLNLYDTSGVAVATFGAAGEMLYDTSNTLTGLKAIRRDSFDRVYVQTGNKVYRFFVDTSIDADGDGTTVADGDCDDEDDQVQLLTWYQDDDADGYGQTGSTLVQCEQPVGYAELNNDCDDSTATTNPGASEICNSVDDNCDSNIDEGVLSTWYQDSDFDGYGNAAVSQQACSKPASYVDDSTDCNDSAYSVNPGGNEVCNDQDDNCNGQIDEGFVQYTFWEDNDHDGSGDPASTPVVSCKNPISYKANNRDCDDTNFNIKPNGNEVCGNGIDENCDGVDALCAGNDQDQDGFDNSVDCNDLNAAIFPGATEICDYLDNNCDGAIDEGVQMAFYDDVDQDGYGDPGSTPVYACVPIANKVEANTDCDDANHDIKPSATEICDGIDNNCNGSVDESVTTSYFEDNDSDGFGDPSLGADYCADPGAGFTTDSSDCNDQNANLSPDGTEVCDDGIDQNCDGVDAVCPNTDTDVVDDDTNTPDTDTDTDTTTDTATNTDANEDTLTEDTNLPSDNVSTAAAGSSGCSLSPQGLNNNGNSNIPLIGMMLSLLIMIRLRFGAEPE